MAWTCSWTRIVLSLTAFLVAVVAQAARPDPVLLDNERNVLQQSIVDKVNSNRDAGWKAALNARFDGHKVKDFKRLCGTLLTPVNEIAPSVPVHSVKVAIDLPKSFDAREAWPHCPSLQSILDQGHCGSCWAFGSVEALTDRFCTAANITVALSENDLLACCGYECGNGCGGGYPIKAWQYFQRAGVVTADCNPYFDNVGCAHPGCTPTYDTPKCVKECVNDEDWTSSKHFGVNAYRLSSNPQEIMADLYQNGPVEVSFRVYEDFAHYKSGVYRHVQGEYTGGHAVKLIGWGTTADGVDYWLLANSWNRGWGEDGFFKMVRGVNECGIESGAVAGLPYSDNLMHLPF